jgi:hypothetical protein
MAEIGWAGYIGGDPEPEPPYDPVWVDVIYQAFTELSPYLFGEVFWVCGDEHDHERRAAIGLVVEWLNDQLVTYRPGTLQHRDAVARARELSRVTGMP